MCFFCRILHFFVFWIFFNQKKKFKQYFLLWNSFYQDSHKFVDVIIMDDCLKRLWKIKSVIIILKGIRIMGKTDLGQILLYQTGTKAFDTKKHSESFPIPRQSTRSLSKSLQLFLWMNYFVFVVDLIICWSIFIQHVVLFPRRSEKWTVFYCFQLIMELTRSSWNTLCEFSKIMLRFVRFFQ